MPTTPSKSFLPVHRRHRKDPKPTELFDALDRRTGLRRRRWEKDGLM